MTLKKRLAREIVTQLYSQKAASDAEECFTKVFQKREVPEEIQEFALPFTPLTPVMLQQRAMLKELLNRLNPLYLGEHGMSVDITHLLVVTNLAKSREAAKRFLVQGAIEIDGEKVTNNMVTIRNGSVIKVGKRRFVRLIDAD